MSILCDESGMIVRLLYMWLQSTYNILAVLKEFSLASASFYIYSLHAVPSNQPGKASDASIMQVVLIK